MDQETAVNRGEDLQKMLQQKGVKWQLRSVRQHAVYIERRGAILRDTIHKLKTQADHNNRNYTFESIVAEAVYAGNALLQHNGYSPHTAVFGRTPPLIPGPRLMDPQTPVTLEDTERLRFSVVEALAQASTTDRVRRSLKTKPAVAVQ